ncbi:carboxylesterase family protein [Novosphingobium sp. SG720]|uniref:carboxylesterase/lipase family protein n=1 Tax=Novosphingobium sp. SG720 TaxID=2586998 RepID=UPI00144692DF|nr:carboxylesterase family protein [Novosphingobium sp. SG720]NKJ42257.1 para-nitrobenzyl esterase [Novosphingobium sp. SG720]
MSTLDRRSFLSAGGAALAATAASAHTPTRRPSVVTVTGGKVAGRATAVPGVTAWLGIPYAAPPVGPMRWRPPGPVQPWRGVRPGDRFGASPCAMPQSFDGPDQRVPGMSEDCLTLNVWAPPRADKPRPVMVWIYGGAYVSGTTDDPRYDGAAMAGQDVIFVSINYRVGILGFFAHPELASESPDGVSGNYALLDQIAALRWVKENIAAFGGDPGNVTILGQSAGAFSVAYHLVLPQSRGLFHRAIAQSGAPMGQVNGLSMIADLAPMEQAGLAFGAKVGAPRLADLRKMDAMALVRAYDGSWNFQPALDGHVIPAHPFAMIRDGNHARVPLLAGYNADEGAIFAPMGGGTVAGLDAALTETFGPLAAKARAVYPAQTAQEAAARGAEVFGDLIFNWNTAALASAMARFGSDPAYLYHFTYDGMPRLGNGTRRCAFHGAEIGLVLRTLGARGEPVSAEQRAISAMLSGYWLDFARQGDPNGGGRPAWPRFVPGTPSVFHLEGLQPRAGEIPFARRMALIGEAWANPILQA